MRTHKLRKPDFPAAVFALTQYTFGDKDYGDPRHHGTPQQRGEAVVAGFRAAFYDRLTFAAALEKGVIYVHSIAV